MRLSTFLGLLVAAGWLSQGLAAATGTPAGTLIDNRALIQGQDSRGHLLAPVSTNLVSTSVSQVVGLALQAPQTQQAIWGTTVDLPHTLTNAGNGSDGAHLTVSGSRPWQTSIVLDTNGNGVADPGEPVITDLPAMAAGAITKLVVVVVIPPGLTTAGTDTVTLTAASSHSTTDTVSNVDTIDVVGPVITATKTVSAASARPGDTLTYDIAFQNTGSRSADSLVVTDTLPAGVAYIPGSLVASPAGTTQWFDGANWVSTQPSPAQIQRLRVTLSQPLPPNAPGDVKFQVQVQGGLPPGTLANSATIDFNDSQGVPRPQVVTNSVTTAVSQKPGVALLGAPEATVVPGRTTKIIDTVTNTGNTADTFNLTVAPSSVPTGWTVQLLKSDGTTPLTDTSGDGLPDTGPLNPGASLGFVVEVTVPAAYPTGRAAVPLAIGATSASQPAISASAMDPVQVAGQPVITATKTVSPAEAAPGDRVTYTLTYAVSQAPAGSLTITDTLPNGLSFVPGSAVLNGSPVQPDPVANGTVTIRTGLLLPGASGTLTFQALVASGVVAGTQITNTAIVEATDTGGSPIATAATSAAVVGVKPVWGVQFSPDRSGFARAGDTISYLHALANIGNAPETFTLTATSDHGIAWIFFLAGAGGNPTGGALTQVTVPPAASVQILVQGVVPASLANETTDVSHVSVAGAHQETAAVTDTTHVNGPVINVKKTVSPTGDQPPGFPLVYTITYSNTGMAPALSARILDPLPDLVQFVSAGNGGSYDAATRQVTWQIGDLAPGASGSVTVSVQIVPAAANQDLSGKVIKNTATLQAQTPHGGVVSVASTDADTGIAAFHFYKISLVASPEIIIGDGKEFSTLTATVLRDDGAPAPDGTPAVFDTQAGHFENGQHTFTTTTVNGIAAVKLIGDKLESDTPLHVPADIVVGTPRTGLSRATVEILFYPGGVTGVVTDQKTGRPIAGATVIVRDSMGNVVGSVISGPDGSYTVPVPKTDTFQVQVVAKDATGVDRQVGGNLQIQVTGHGQAATPAPNGILGRLFDRNTGAPVAGAEIEVLNSDGTPVMVPGPNGTLVALMVMTASDGSYRIPSLSTANYVIRVVTAGSNYYSVGTLIVADSRPGQVVVDADLPLDPLGYVYDAKTNARLAGATVTLVQADSGAPVAVDSGQQNPQATNPNGIYSFVVSPGRYRLKVTAPGYADRYTPAFDVQTAGAPGAPGVVNQLVPMDKLTRVSLKIVKTANVTHVKSGDPIVYTIAVTNAGDTDATKVAVTDTLPAGMSLPSVPVGAAYDAATGTLTWRSDRLAKGQTQTYVFTALAPQTSTPGDTTVANFASVVSQEDPTPREARADVALEVPYLEIAKRADKSLVEVGDVVTYDVTVTNRSTTTDAKSVTITDDLPVGVRYLPGSTFLNAQRAPDPIGLASLRWTIPSVPAGKSVDLLYRAAIGAPRSGTLINRARLDGLTPAGGPLQAGPAQVTIRLQRNSFADRSFIWGKVYWDKDNNGLQGRGDPGLAGVAVILEDGSVAVTDEYGKYSFPDVTPGTHVARLDEATLPAGARPSGWGPRFARDPSSQFVNLMAGGSYQADFPVAGKNLVAAPVAAVAPMAAARRRGRGKAASRTGSRRSRRKGTLPATTPRAIITPAVGALDAARSSARVQPSTLPQDLPVDRLTIITPAPRSASALDRIDVAFQAPQGARPRLTANGKDVPDSQIGQTSSDTTRHTVYYRFVGVPLTLGPNKIEASAVLPNGTVVTDQVSVSLIGSPSRMVLEARPRTAPADSKTDLAFTADVRDEWGIPVADGTVVTFTADRGEWDGPGATTGSHQLRVPTEAGLATARLHAARIGPVLVHATADSTFADARAEFLTPSQPLLVIGLLDGQLGGGAFQVRGFGRDDLSPTSGAGVASFFAKGTVLGGYNLTAFYNTQESREDKLLRDFNPDRPYPIYGDSSTLVYEAPTQTHLFVGIEKQAFRFLLGDFNTDFLGTEFGAYRRTLNGLRVDDGGKRWSFRALASRTEQAVVRDEIPGKGISGYYFLTRGPVVENTERITLEVRDRYQPDLVLRTTQLYRYTDYDINYQQGTLFFKQPVPTFDLDDNPVYIIAVYESLSSPVEQWVTGARAQALLGKGLRLGSEFVSEQRQGGNYLLYGADLHWAGTRWLNAEGEMTHSSAGSQSGSAWQMSVTVTPSKRAEARAFMKDVSQGFENASTSLFEQGLRKYGASGIYKASAKTTLGFDFYHSSDERLGDVVRSLTAGASQKIGRGTADVRFEQQAVSQTAGGAGNSYSILTGRVQLPLTHKLALYAARDQNLAAAESTIRPTATILGMQYKIGPRTLAYVRQKWSDNPHRSALLIGTESRFSREGSAYAQYQIGGTIDGERNQASVGLNNQFRLTKAMTANLAYENVRSLASGAGSNDHNSVSASLEYLPLSQRFRASAKFEMRSYGGASQSIWSLDADGQVNRDWSLLAKYQKFGELGSATALNSYAPARYSGTLLNTNLLIGMAYRPQHNSRLNALFKYEIKTAMNPLVTPTTSGRIHLLSAEANWQATRRLELYGRVAFKQNSDSLLDQVVGSYTGLVLGRATYAVTRDWDVGAEVRLLRERAAGLRNLSWALEVGRTLANGLRVGVGYNVAGRRDLALAEGDSWSRGVYVRLSMKFSEGHHPTAGTAQGWHPSRFARRPSSDALQPGASPGSGTYTEPDGRQADGSTLDVPANDASGSTSLFNDPISTDSSVGILPGRSLDSSPVAGSPAGGTRP